MDPAQQVQDAGSSQPSQSVSPPPQDGTANHGKSAKIPKYKRKSGACRREGTDFEIKMAALIYLRARRALKSFLLGINDESAGDFDDITLLYENAKKKKQELLLQLKHLDGKMITKNALSSPTGKFSLNEFFSSVKKMMTVPKCCRDTPLSCASDPASCSSKDIHFILFTDKPVSVGQSKVSNLNSTVTDLLCTSDVDSVFKVDIQDEVCSTFKNEPEAAEFAKKLYIFAEQIDVHYLDEIIKQEFLKISHRIIPDYKTFHRDYIEKIEAYWKMTGKTNYLTESWREWSTIQNRLLGNDFLLSPIKFDEQILQSLAGSLLNHHNQKVHIKCNDCNVALRSMKVNQALFGFGKKRHLFTSIDEPQESLHSIMKLWKSKAYDILVIDQGTNTNASTLPIQKNIFQLKEKRLIFISDGRVDISEIFPLELGVWHELDEEFSFQQLDKSTQEAVLDQKIHFQGAEIMLRDLEVTNMLVGESLTSFLTGEVTHFGHKLPSPGEFYTTRTICNKVAIKKDILVVNGIPDKFYIMGITPDELNDKVRKVRRSKNIVGGIQTNQCQSIDSVINLPIQDSGDPYHILEMEGEVFYWRQSFGDPRVLFQFVEFPEDVNFMTTCKTSNPKEDELMASALRKVIITGEPGMGKSDLFLHMAHQLKLLHKNFWIIPLNLEDVAEYLKKGGNKDVDKVNLLRMLASETGVQESILGRKFLEAAVELTGNVIILCDGFDETYPNNSKLVLDALHLISQTKVNALWVSSRQAVVDQLETCLQTKAFSLNPFTEAEAKKYLCNFLGEEDAYNIMEKLQSSTSNGTKPVSSIPLHLKMIRVLFVSDKFPTNCEVLNLYELYKSFIEFLLEKHLNKILKDVSPYIRQTIGNGLMKLHKVCSIIALDVLNELHKDDSKEVLKDFKKNYHDVVHTGEEKIGIMDGLSEDGRPRFVHRTFAEYFGALWLEENKDNNSKFICAITFDPQWNVLCAVFNRLLAEDCSIHLALLDHNVSVLRQRLMENPDLNSKDAGGRTPLHVVSLCGGTLSTEMMKLLLYQNPEPNLEVRDGLLNLTPLYYAVKAGLWDGVRLLLHQNAHVEKDISDEPLLKSLRSRLGRHHKFIHLDLQFEINWPIFIDYKTILHLAAIDGKEDCVRMLLERGADVEIKDVNGNTALHDAISKKKTDVAKVLLDNGACVTVANTLGDTPLHLAARWPTGGNIVRLLLDLKANSNVRNQDGDTPLHDAVRFGDKHAVDLLLQHGASIQAENKDGNTPLHLATNKEDFKYEVIESLLKEGACTEVLNKKNNDGDTPLHLAVQKQCLTLVQTLFNYGASPSVRNKYGNTPLHIAAREKNLDVVELLLQKKASPNEKNNLGSTPLHAAVRYSTFQMVKLLLYNKAWTTIQNNNLETPLHEACKELNVNIVTSLLKFKASTSIVNKDQDTPLHIAARFSDLNTVKLLQENGAELCSVNKDGNTPLHLAISYKSRHRQNTNTNHHFDVIAYLATYGRRCLHIPNKNGDTPLHIAVEKKNCKVVELLLQLNANMRVKNKSGETPLSIAEKYRLEDIVRILKEHSVTNRH